MKWLKLIILGFGLLWLLTPSIAFAQTSAQVTITASGWVADPGDPSGFTITYISDYEVGISWTKGAAANNTMIRRVVGRVPADRTDGVLVYYGMENYVVDYNVNLDTTDDYYYYRAWSEDSDGDWSSNYAEGRIRGAGMTLIALSLLALGLTVAMFITRNALLGFPSCIMWAVLGTYAYTQSSTAWGDWQYYLFFASAFGMTIFCALGAFGLREKKDTIADEEMERGEPSYIDEKRKKDEFDDIFGADEEIEPNQRTQELKKRAEDRRISKARRHKWE